MKFCLITSFYPPFHSGGCGLHVYHLANLLARDGHRVEVVCSGDAHAYKIEAPRPGRYPHHPGVTVHRVASGVGKLEPLLTYLLGRPVFGSRRLDRILSRGFEVIHYHNISLFGGMSIIRRQKALKLFTLHTYWLFCPTHYLWKNRKEVCLEKECFSCLLAHHRPPQLWRSPGRLREMLSPIDSLIMPCRYMLDRHREEGFAGRMDCLPYFVDPVPVPSDPSLEEEFGPHRPFFLFVARLESYKGPQLAVSAWKKKAGSSRLLIVGTGTEYQRLRRLAGDDERIRFLHYVAPEKLAWLYRNAVALLAPSVWPEMGNQTVLQAMSCGTPVIASRQGCLPELVEGNSSGLLFETEEKLLEAVSRMEEGAFRSRFSAPGRSAHERLYTPEVFLRNYYRLVDELLAKNQ